MKKINSLSLAAVLTLAFCGAATAKSGTISTTRAGTISTTSTGTISTTAVGTISTTRTGTISTTAATDQAVTITAVANSWGRYKLLDALFSVWLLW